MVMHARKPQRMSDGYFEKHQTHPYQSSKYSSKRDYEREASSRSTSYMRDRDNSPSGGGNNSLNNGNNSYRSASPDLDSPRESRDRDRDRDRERYQSSTYLQKMREKDRDRESYKKDKYSDCLRSPKDKRDRRDRDSEHRTNHDRIEQSSRRSSKLCSNQSSSEKRSGSDDRERDRSERERDRDRDRDRDRERDRDRDRERITRIGDWSEHVSSSGKKYYYNCKTEVSQWEKPREWLEKERLQKEQHREYREKERDRDREDRFSRSSYGKHSSSRGGSRIRWPHDSEGPPAHRRRHDDSQDMDISPGDSTPTSEGNYSHSSTPTTQQNNNNNADGGGGVGIGGTTTTGPGPLLLTNALPRLASHPSTPTNSQLHFSTPSCIGLNTTPTCTMTSSSGTNSISAGHSQIAKLSKNDGLHTSLPASSPSTLSSGTSSLCYAIPSSNAATDMMNSNTPGPPPPVSLASLPKILSQITGNKSLDQTELNPQKALQTINNALMMSSRQQHAVIGGANGSGICSDQINQVTSNNSNNLREHALNSPLYNLSHMYSMSMMNHSGTSPYVTAASVASSQVTNMGIGSQLSGANVKVDTSGGIATMLIGEGPPTPTQEMDIAGEHRKLDGTSSSLSSLQGVVPSSQASRSQGPSLTPSLANYFRADLIAHVTNWPADMVEKQAQKCSEEAHIFGDLQCTNVSADLKMARSLVRITEITATLQEQKVMYLRQQIRRLEELKSQNSFMSDDL